MEHFALIFEGPGDESPATLRRLRSTLLGEFQLSIAEAQTVFNELPVRLRSAAEEAELTPLYQAIQRAGGRATIVRCREENPYVDLALTLEESNPHPEAPLPRPVVAGQSLAEVNFELEEPAPSPAVPGAPTKTPPADRESESLDLCLDLQPSTDEVELKDVLVPEEEIDELPGLLAAVEVLASVAPEANDLSLRPLPEATPARRPEQPEARVSMDSSHAGVACPREPLLGFQEPAVPSPSPSLSLPVEIVARPVARGRTMEEEPRPLRGVMWPALLGTLLLGLANWIYFSSARPSLPLPGSISQRVSTEVVSVAPVTSAGTSETTLTGHERHQDFEVVWSLTRRGALIDDLALTITVPDEPPSPEDIAAGREHLRVRKIEVSGVPVATAGESFSAAGSARVYIVAGGEKTRFIAPLFVAGRWSAAGSLQGSFVISNEVAPPEPTMVRPPWLTFERGPGGEAWRISLGGSFTSPGPTGKSD